jgi:arginyl-tRNA synthetase
VGVVERAREQLAKALEDAYAAAAGEGLLPRLELPPFVVEVPREREHGDFAANLALLLAGPSRKPPRAIARILAERIGAAPVQAVEVAGPGFINFHLRPGWVLEAVSEALEAGPAYGRVDLGAGQKVQVEFVSANPTGLLHMGNARGAALGDTLASLLEFAGYTVEREFYINDAGHQIEKLALSMEARYRQALGQDAPVPEDGYHGLDLLETAQRFADRYGDACLAVPHAQRLKELTGFALAEKLEAIKGTLAGFGVRYDRWFAESELHESGRVEACLAALTARGFTYLKDDALWFAGQACGLEKDEVLVRTGGMPTYFAADIAYHVDKLERGFTRIIDIWGADHHGHVARLHAALRALGLDEGALTVVIMQLVRLFQNGEMVRMSKRTGRFVTLEELVGEAGKDAARYFFVLRSAESHLDFDLDLARQQTNDNPVYYIQYAHARICSILRQLAEPLPDPDISLLREEAELALARQIAWFPEEIVLAARQLAPHRLARYTHELAGLLHSFYNSHRVITGDPDLTAARVALVGATRVVLRTACRIIGVGAPERM